MECNSGTRPLRLEPAEFDALRAVFDLLRESGEKVVWGPKSNVDGGFAFGIGRSDPVVYGYASGDLHFYPRKFSPARRRCKEKLEAFLQSEFGKTVERDHLELKVKHWGPRLDILLE